VISDFVRSNAGLQEEFGDVADLMRAGVEDIHAALDVSSRRWMSSSADLNAFS
jgi:hypothetical protein